MPPGVKPDKMKSTSDPTSVATPNCVRYMRFCSWKVSADDLGGVYLRHPRRRASTSKLQTKLHGQSSSAIKSAKDKSSAVKLLSFSGLGMVSASSKVSVSLSSRKLLSKDRFRHPRLPQDQGLVIDGHRGDDPSTSNHLTKGASKAPR